MAGAVRDSRPDVQIDTILWNFHDLPRSPVRQCKTRAFIRYEQHTRMMLTGYECIHHTSARTTYRDGSAREKGLVSLESRRIFHAAIHRADDDGHAEGVEKRGSFGRDRNRLMHDVDPMTWDQTGDHPALDELIHEHHQNSERRAAQSVRQVSGQPRHQFVDPQVRHVLDPMPVGWEK